MNKRGHPIPIKAAKQIADDYGYDQVVVIARCVGNDGKEHVTTYGRNKAHCRAAAKIGDFSEIYYHEVVHA
jgi:hypothetical protein